MAAAAALQAIIQPYAQNGKTGGSARMRFLQNDHIANPNIHLPHLHSYLSYTKIPFL